MILSGNSSGPHKGGCDRSHVERNNRCCHDEAKPACSMQTDPATGNIEYCILNGWWAGYDHYRELCRKYPASFGGAMEGTPLIISHIFSGSFQLLNRGILLSGKQSKNREHNFWGQMMFERNLEATPRTKEHVIPTPLSSAVFGRYPTSSLQRRWSRRVTR